MLERHADDGRFAVDADGQICGKHAGCRGEQIRGRIGGSPGSGVPRQPLEVLLRIGHEFAEPAWRLQQLRIEPLDAEVGDDRTVELVIAENFRLGLEDLLVLDGIAGARLLPSGRPERILWSEQYQER